MNDDGEAKVITTRCGRRIVVSHAAIPATPIRWVTVRVSSGQPEDHSEWISLNPAEAAELGAALIARATTD
ncbi:hypothetical protein [Lentzea aerocolonigenes]|uniref:hypothetical protein n=1 Tax=Lentzea aerocolonigenes TaxID=68170 RepID=UPI0004C38C1F|nr:hypothetical protein [Lentzea aerocolonigenes]MCP2247312.1 hypothetical protein [Lentzea aerocolonigenes]